MNHHKDDTELDGPLLYGRVLDGNGGGRPIGWEEAKAWCPANPGEVLWVHLCRHYPAVGDWLENGLCIPEPTAELLVSDSTRPRAFTESGALVSTLRAINFNPGAEPEDMVALQLWCDGTRLVTLRRQPLQSPRDVLAAIDRGTGPCDAGRTISDIIEAVVDHMSYAIVDTNEEIDKLEAADLDSDADATLTAISDIRRNCLALKRHMAPQHEALEAISRSAPHWFGKKNRREIAESIDRLRRFLDDLDISKESALVLQDDIRARSVAKSGRTSFMLTLVASIFLPLTFITGLLGMNVSGIPSATDPNAFWVVVGLCGGILVMQLALFWRWKWL